MNKTSPSYPPESSGLARLLVIVILLLPILIASYLVLTRNDLKHKSAQAISDMKDFRLSLDQYQSQTGNRFKPEVRHKESSASVVLEKLLQKKYGLSKDVIENFPFTYFHPIDTENFPHTSTPLQAYPMLKKAGVTQLKDAIFDTEELGGIAVVLRHDGSCKIYPLSEEGKLMNADGTLYQVTHLPMSIHYPEEAKTIAQASIN